MTTRKIKQKSFRLLWKVRRNDTGELKFIPIKDKKSSSGSGGTMYASVTSSVMKSADKARSLASAVVNAGGSISAISGRLVSVIVPEGRIEDIGEVFDSFGCQWDFEGG